MTGARVRVLQVLGSSAGGVARHVGQVVHGAGRRGWQVRVAGPTSVRGQVLGPRGEGRVASEHERTAFDVVEIADRPSPRDVAALRRLRRLAAGADVVHAHGLRAGALAVLAARSRRDRPAVVVTLHNLPVGGPRVLALAAALEQVVARGSDAVLGVSGDLVERARRRGGRLTERALVPAPRRPEAGPPAATRAALGVEDGTALLVTVGRLAPQKGLDLLAGTAERLRGEGLVWLVAGDGPLQASLEERTTRAGLPVRLLGRREDVADLMAAADVVVSTARWEGQPLGIQEALSLGAAVVATDVGGTAEVTQDAAVLVPQEPEAVARAVLGLLHDDARRGQMRARALARAAELPDLDDTLDQLERVYAAVLRARRPTAGRGSR